MSVPSNWVSVDASGDKTGKVLLALGRRTTPIVGIPASVDIKVSPFAEKPWTLKSAAEWQQNFIAANANDPGSKVLAATVSATKPMVCVKTTIDAKTKGLHCTIIGTVLQFDFMGGDNAWPEAEQIMHSLR